MGVFDRKTFSFSTRTADNLGAIGRATYAVGSVGSFSVCAFHKIMATAKGIVLPLKGRHFCHTIFLQTELHAMLWRAHSCANSTGVCGVFDE